jgi:hypothetical protein
MAAATADGMRSVTISLNIPAPTGALLKRLRSVQASAVCALRGSTRVPEQRRRVLVLELVPGPDHHRRVLARELPLAVGRGCRRADYSHEQSSNVGRLLLSGAQ